MTNTKRTKIMSAVLAVLASTISLAEPANAKSYDFAYSPSELESAEGTAKMENRLRKFARHSCNSSSPLKSVRQERECRDDIEAQLRARIWSQTKATKNGA